METISVRKNSFGNNFSRRKCGWKKVLDFTTFLEKNSFGKKIIGKTFLWKKFLKLANPWTNIPLEKNSFGKMYIGKNFLKNNFFGKNYLGNFYFGKNPLDIFTGCQISRVSPDSDQSSCVEWSGPGPAIRSVTKLKTDRAIPTGRILHFSQKTISLPLRIEMIDDNLIAGSRQT